MEWRIYVFVYACVGAIRKGCIFDMGLGRLQNAKDDLSITHYSL